MAGYMHLATTLKAVSVRHSHRRSYLKQAFSLAVWRGASASKPYSALPVASTRRWSSPVAPKDGDRTYLEWEARLHGGERVAGVTILTTDASGMIAAIAIHHRPLPGALRCSRELRRDLAGKIEADLFYGAHSIEAA
jgi:hypothetical protein